MRIPLCQRRQALADRSADPRRRSGQGGGPAHQIAQGCSAAGGIGATHGSFEGGNLTQMLAQRSDGLGARGAGIFQPVGRAAPALVMLAKVGNEALLVVLRIVDDGCQPIEPGLPEPVIDHIERRALFAHEQHPFALSGIVGDQVGDGLGLARARRALDDVAASRAREGDRLILRRIARHHAPLLGRRDRRRGILDEGPRFDREDLIEGGLHFGRLDQRVVIAHQRHLLVVEVGEGDAGAVDLPAELVPFAARLAIGEALGLGDHQLALGGVAAAGGDALRQGIGLHELLEQREAERAIILARIAEIGLGADRLAGAGAAVELVHPRHRALQDQADRGALLQFQPDAGLAFVDLAADRLMHRLDRCLGQIDRFGQLDGVELAQHMAQRRVEFGDAVRAGQHILIAHALALGDLDRQPQQG